MSVRVQELIHKWEVGAGARLVRIAVIGLLVVALAVLYDAIAFRNFSTQEAMDAAQLGRNLAEGKGFTTDFVRPFSLFLLARHQAESADDGRGGVSVVRTNVAGSAETASDRKAQAADHPDLSNAPLYPAMLALLHKINPVPEPDLSKQQSFSIYFPDLWIGMFNQLLLAVAAMMVFGLAKYLFDAPVAWASSIVFVLTELFWRFSVSGLSTVLLMLLVLGLAGIVARLEKAARETPPVTGRMLRLSLAAGVMVGLAALARYSMACLIVPVVVMLGTLVSPKRALLVMAAVAAFLVVIAPWTARNFFVSGTPFGTAGFAMMEATSTFPEHQLERSLDPKLARMDTGEYVRKLTTNLREMVSNDLPKLGGNWVSGLFLAGLLVPFRNPVLGRMRVFVLLSIVVLAVTQALGRTALSVDSPEINSENLLVVVAPMVFIYGVSLFFILRDQLNLEGPAGRGVLWAAFYLLAGAPLLFTVIAQHPSPVAYPPYYPPWIQQKTRAVREDQTVMSDIPWAVAWYGKRPSVWLSLKLSDTRGKEDFEAVDRVRNIRALYVTARSLKNMDIKSLSDWARSEAPDREWESLRKMVTELGQAMTDDNAKPAYLEKLRSIYNSVERNWVRGGGGDWESFVLGIFVKREVPTGFPLQRAVGGIMPEIFLTESQSAGSKGK